MKIVPLSQTHLLAWTQLFEASACTCHCRYWHFSGDKNGWLERCAMVSEQNRDEARALIATEDPGARGLLALDGERGVGWMKLTPRAAVPKLRNQPVYRSLDLGNDDGIYAVGCFLVDPEYRRRGVARALLAAAPDHVRAWGGRAIEAYPRLRPESLRDDEAWQGPLSLFHELRFREVGTTGTVSEQYPVFRRDL